MALPQVVVPVFNAVPLVRACLAALDQACPDAEVLLIDDASTDAEVLPLLEQWVGGRPMRRLVRQPRNRGFVETANLGLRLTDRDVVLLNSDTEVTGGWLEALGRCLASDPAIATATPWTNNGEIASLPDLCRAAPPPPDREAVARVIAAAGPARYPELPTAVGFCMALARGAIRRVGLFDAETFGHGYGEENDFSVRAAAAGLRNVLCDDAYVVHHGGGSFGPLGVHPDAASMRRLAARHPDYEATVAAFIAADPLAARRAELGGALAQAGVDLG